MTEKTRVRISLAIQTCIDNPSLNRAIVQDSQFKTFPVYFENGYKIPCVEASLILTGTGDTINVEILVDNDDPLVNQIKEGKVIPSMSLGAIIFAAPKPKPRLILYGIVGSQNGLNTGEGVKGPTPDIQELLDQVYTEDDLKKLLTGTAFSIFNLTDDKELFRWNFKINEWEEMAQ